MRLKHWESSALNCRPLTVVKADSEIGLRVGGTPPVGVSPSHVDELTRYFATIELSDDLELSLFFSVDPNQTQPRSISKNKYVFHDESETLTQFVVHKAAKRSKDSPLAAPFEGHGLKLEEKRVDSPNLEDEAKDDVWTHHKLGGVPFYYVLYEDILEPSAELLANGWIHLLQMTSLGEEDASVKGEWPIWKWMFHVFAKPKGDGLEFRYIWA
jgi:hypothetical protein